MEIVKVTTNKFILKAKNIHGNKYDYSKVNYINLHVPVEIVCNIHGSFWQKPSDHINRKRGCHECGGSKISNTEKFIKKANDIHNYKYDYSKSNYKKNIVLIEIVCNIHGSFWQSPRDHLNKRGCKNCGSAISKPEIEWLNFLNILDKYRYQIIYINGKKFKPDAYNSITNTVYEFYGDFWHGNPKFFKAEDINQVNKKTYGSLYKATLEKEKILREAGYNIISIWESDWLKIKK